MFRKQLLVASLALLMFYGCSEKATENLETDEPRIDQTIVACLSRNVPGNFVVGGERYGYAYEILEAYAADKGVNLEIRTGRSAQQVAAAVRDGESRFGLTFTSDAASAGADLYSIPFYSTSYVLLAASRSGISLSQSGGSVSALLDDRIVMVSSGFEVTRSYDRLLDSTYTAQMYVTPRPGFDLAGELARGDFDILICEKSEALLADHMIGGLTILHEFAEQVPLSLCLDGGDQALGNDFLAWLDSYRGTARMASLEKFYFDKGLAGKICTINKPNRVVGGISVWDDMIREVGRREEIDWRLLSAIAYNESRFRTDVVSRRGAKGMMQIMPVVARQFKVDQSMLLDPETNLTIAAKLIKMLDNMLAFGEDVGSEDRLSITLAAYNGGVGHVMSARRLALNHGEDCDSWQVVSRYLELMGDRSFTCEEVKFRRFTGSGETLAFVDDIVERYDTYRRSVN